ncbi:transglycosylase domain-containing protein [Cryobacterium sp. 1639]|uniref:transglycosylase domain-containing protein n=1 Tax=Cryobacterium inferilacus TaxID=2866629 RepID=UPI001C737042|nr:transglycosylase domain-containing protein [Cryobacterium sp. 1639]MBX0299885.1 transglycosylase domain-containing protein [Cryobacterium sp. 1639]
MSAKKSTVSGALGGFLSFIGMSAIAGVLVTVAVTPALALTGITATNTINTFENIPNYLAVDQLSQRSNIYAVQPDGNPYLMASFYDQNRVEVPIEEMSQFVQDAAVAGEDPRFEEHGGVDIQGTVRGAISTVTGAGVQGGSSITQQYVKNVLVQKCEVLNDDAEVDACYDDATKTTADRKLREMRMAIGLEKEYTKEQILQGYLNITLFGGVVYGVESAANYYYNTSAANLTLPQAASLVAIVNNPEAFRLDRPESETNGAANGYARNKERRDYILGEMLQYEKISQADYDAAIATPIEPTITLPSTGCQTAGGSAYFCDYVSYILKSDPTFGETEDERLANFRRGGYDVYTTLDLELQDAAEQTMSDNVPNVATWDVGGVAVSVEVGTGRVLAMAQNKIYSQDPEVQATGAQFTSINYNTDFNQGGSSGFQPGSTFKVFTLADWLEEGHSLNERVDSSLKTNWGTFKDSCNGDYTYTDSLKNDAGESGRNYSALESTINSYNTGYMGMAKELDLCEIRKTAESFGIHTATGAPMSQTASMVLGTNEIAPLSMAVAYAGIANGGTTCSPIAIDRIVVPDGSEITPPASTCTESVSTETAAGMAYAMERVLSQGSAQQSYYDTFPRVPMIGKTGTTNEAQDTWMSGASSKVATVVGVVNVTGDQNQRNYSANFESGSAATARHRMWPDIMSVANAKYGGDEFEEASRSSLYGAQVTVPDVTGQTTDAATAVLEDAGFTVVVGGETDSDLPAGTVARTSPSDGSTVAAGATVTLTMSNGNVTALPDVVGDAVEDAEDTLDGYDVVIIDRAVTDPDQDGEVLSMNPAAGTGAAEDSTVQLFVGRFDGNTDNGNTNEDDE